MAKDVLERWTNPKHSRRTCTCVYRLQYCREESAGVAKRPRERSPTRPPTVTIRNFFIAVHWCISLPSQGDPGANRHRVVATRARQENGLVRHGGHQRGLPHLRRVLRRPFAWCVSEFATVVAKLFVVPAGALPVPVSIALPVQGLNRAQISGRCRPQLRQYVSKPAAQLLPISPSGSLYKRVRVRVRQTLTSPIPSWPCSLLPHAYRCPSVATASECRLPTLMCATRLLISLPCTCLGRLSSRLCPSPSCPLAPRPHTNLCV